MIDPARGKLRDTHGAIMEQERRPEASTVGSGGQIMRPPIIVPPVVTAVRRFMRKGTASRPQVLRHRPLPLAPGAFGCDDARGYIEQDHGAWLE